MLSMNDRVSIILRELKKLFPDASIVLKYGSSWELLVAVILSAQCTDKMVNKVTARLFVKYRSLDDYLNTSQVEFEQDIHSTGFFRNKAKNILATAKIIKEKYHGEVPRTMEDLLTLPGVARKTANVVMGNAWGKVEGIAVDTHVRRLAKVWGLTKHDDPVKIERDLMQLLPQSEWFRFTYRTIEYGRAFCIAKKHQHEECPLTKLLKG